MLLGLQHVRLPNLFTVARSRMASTSVSTSLIPSKRRRESSLVPSDSVSPPAAATSQRFRDSIVLAPMVRSGTSEIFIKQISLVLLTAFSANPITGSQIRRHASVGTGNRRQSHASCQKSCKWLAKFGWFHLIRPDTRQPRLV